MSYTHNTVWRSNSNKIIQGQICHRLFFVDAVNNKLEIMKRQFVYFLLMLLFASAFVYAWLTKDNYKNSTIQQNTASVSAR
jgi:hypothetical protein